MLRVGVGLIAWLNISGLIWYGLISQHNLIGGVFFWLAVAGVCAVAPRSGVMDK